MKKKIFSASLKLAFCLVFAGMVLFLHISRLNDLTRLQLKIPLLEKEVSEINEENRHMQYLIKKFNNPAHLMELMRLPQYSHLKFPLENEVIRIENSNILLITDE